MRAIYECPHCGEQNMVPQDVFGKHYTCYNCKNDFSIVRYADCPSCGETNLLEEPSDDMTYVCHKCGQEFEYVEGGSRPKPGLPKRGSFGPKRRQVEYIKPMANVDSTPCVPQAEDYGLASPIVALFKLATYSGRATRWEFNGLLLMIITLSILGGVVEKHDSDSAAVTVLCILGVYVLFCLIASGARRIQDCVHAETAATALTGGLVCIGGIVSIPIGILCLLALVVILATSPSKD